MYFRQEETPMPRLLLLPVVRQRTLPCLPGKDTGNKEKNRDRTSTARIIAGKFSRFKCISLSGFAG
jgi:hypothetical protein